GGNWKGRGFGGDTINLITQEAYVDLKIPQISEYFSIVAGVPGFDLGPNHLVMGFIDAPGTKFRIDVPDKFNGFFFHAKLQEGGASNTDFDYDVYGFDAKVPVNPNLTVGGYFIYGLNKSGIGGSSTFGNFSTAIGKSGAQLVGGDPAADGTFPNGIPGTIDDPNSFGFYGGDEISLSWFDFNIVGKAAGFDFIGEVVFSTGSLDDQFRGDMDLGGFAFDLTGSYNLEAAKANVGAKFTYASGDDPSTRNDNEEHQVVNADYIYSRIFWDNSVNGFTGHGNPANAIVFKGFFSLEPFAETPLRLGVDYLFITAVEDRFFGTDPDSGRFFDGSEDSEIGNEIDLYFTYRINDNTVLNGELDFFFPGEYITGKSGIPANDA
ncbi:MAG: alginate export family protein, partial [Nitrospira sp.]|nr:alginate export family protein [Nitrospira sp.]